VSPKVSGALIAASQWPAVVGTAVGAFAGFAGAFFTTRATLSAHAREQETQRAFDGDQRDLDREHDRRLRRQDLDQYLEQARIDRDHEWRQELRQKMLASVADLSAVLGSTLLTAEFLRIGEVRSTVDRVEATLHGAPALISHVRLLFGPKSATADAAVWAHIQLEHLLSIMKQLASAEEKLASDLADDKRRVMQNRYDQQSEGFLAKREEARDSLKRFNDEASAGLWDLSSSNPG
jgi:hypothetical protein